MHRDPATEPSASPANADRLRSWLVLAAFVGTIVFNWLAASGFFGGITTSTISHRHSTVVTPADYAFSIWMLIYLGLAVFSVYQLTRPGHVFSRPIRSLFIFSCALNCAWLFFWVQEQIVLCTALIWLLALVLALIDKKLNDLGAPLFLRGVFGTYLGWVVVAALVNFVIAFFSGRAADFGDWAGATLVILAAALGVIARAALVNYFVPLAVAWGLTAIAVQQSGKTVIVVAAAIGVIACLIASFSFVLILKRATDE